MDTASLQLDQPYAPMSHLLPNAGLLHAELQVLSNTGQLPEDAGSGMLAPLDMNVNLVMTDAVARLAAHEFTETFGWVFSYTS